VSKIVFTTNLQHDAAGRTKNASARLLIAACVWLVIATGCDFPGKPNPADRPVLPANVLEFSALFKQNCAGCHGADGDLGGAPSLHDALFRAIIPIDDLERTVAKGRAGTPMPAFAIEHGGTLTPAQIQVLVYEIKGIRYKMVEKVESGKKSVTIVADAQGLAPKWGPPEPTPTNAPSYLVADTQRQLASDAVDQIRKTTFARACAGCHEDRGQGGEKAGAINGHAFLSLTSPQILRRLIITGRPDLKMPDFAGLRGRPPDFRPLNSQEISDLVALFAYWRQAGSATSEADKTQNVTDLSHALNSQGHPNGKPF
jgi:cytochrome c oxidase cbb3-type subunit 3